MAAVLERAAPSRPYWISKRYLATIFSIGVAAWLGLLIAVAPLPTVAVVLGIAALGILTLITPEVALVALLMFAPMRTLIATEAPTQLPLEIGLLTFLLLCAAWSAHRIAGRKHLFSFAWTNLYTPLLIYVIVTGLTVFNATSIGAWFTEWLKWVLIVGLIALTFDLGQNRRWEWIVFALVIAGVANAILGIYIFFGGSGAEHLLVHGRFFRAFGTFGQPNPFGGFMGLLAPIAIMATCGYLSQSYYFWTTQRRIPINDLLAAAFYGIAALLMTIGVLLSWSRGAWLGFSGALFIMLLAWFRRFWLGALGALLLIFLAGIVWSIGYMPTFFTARINNAAQELLTLVDIRAIDVRAMDITPESYANIERFAHWQAALRMAEQHPWLGVGFGNYATAYGDYRLLNWKYTLGHAHNYYLNVFAETGMIGLIAYLAVFVYVIRLTWQTRAHPDPLSRCITIGLLGAWSHLLIHSLTDNLYVNNVFIHIGIMLGVLTILHREVVGSRIASMR